jgi:formylglycine-generating enzyme
LSNDVTIKLGGDPVRLKVDAGGVRLAANDPKPGEERVFLITDDTKMTFCWIPPGKATLGSPLDEKGRSENEPEKEYVSRGYWLGKYVVTQKEWTSLMQKNPSDFNGRNDNNMKGMDTTQFPVESVTWNDCQDFLNRLNGIVNEKKTLNALGKTGKFALPDDDEWEYACRGGKGNKQPFYFWIFLKWEAIELQWHLTLRRDCWSMYWTNNACGKL